MKPVPIMATLSFCLGMVLPKRETLAFSRSVPSQNGVVILVPERSKLARERTYAVEGSLAAPLPPPLGAFDSAETSRSEVSISLRTTFSFASKEKCPICHRRYDRWGTLGQVNSTLQLNSYLVVPDDLSLLCGHVLFPQQARAVAQRGDVRWLCYFPQRPYTVSLHADALFHHNLCLTHPLLSGACRMTLKLVHDWFSAYSTRGCTARLSERHPSQTQNA